MRVFRQGKLESGHIGKPCIQKSIVIPAISDVSHSVPLKVGAAERDAPKSIIESIVQTLLI
jgi:hypothetical protein